MAKQLSFILNMISFVAVAEVGTLVLKPDWTNGRASKVSYATNYHSVLNRNVNCSVPIIACQAIVNVVFVC